MGRICVDWRKHLPGFVDATSMLRRTFADDGPLKSRRYLVHDDCSSPARSLGCRNGTFQIIETMPSSGFTDLSTPQELFSAKGGNTGLGAYSCVAHPALTDGTGKDIYLVSVGHASLAS